MQRSTAEPTSLRLLLASLHARKCVWLESSKLSRLSLPLQTYRDEFACKTSGSTHRGCRDQHCEQASTTAGEPEHELCGGPYRPLAACLSHF